MQTRDIRIHGVVLSLAPFRYLSRKSFIWLSAMLLKWKIKTQVELLIIVFLFLEVEAIKISSCDKRNI